VELSSSPYQKGKIERNSQGLNSLAATITKHL